MAASDIVQLVIRPLCQLVLGIVCLSCSAAYCRDTPVIGAMFDQKGDIGFPPSPSIVDVTKPPYNAKGDGKSDDTDALQRALSDAMGLHKMIYLPSGTYLVSKTINWSNKNSSGKDAWGFNYVQGQNCLKTVIRLKDATFTDASKTESIMWCGGFGSADWFHNYIQDVTFDIGSGNPGAIGLQFYSNNSGAIRNCRFIADEDSGSVDLDLAHRDMNGPLLVRNCEVVGFRRGISTAGAVNGQTFEHITLRRQTEVGFTNEGQAISIRGMLSDNSVPALSVYGTVCLVDAKLTGRNRAAQLPAIISFNYGRIFLRDIVTTGYSRALADVETPDSAAALRITGPDKPGSAGPNIAEYFSHAATSPFPTPTRSIRLPVEDSPEVLVDSPRTWANVDDFGADPTGSTDSSAAIQKAMDSGATTVFLPGSYALKKTVAIRGKVRRVVGVGGWVDYQGQTTPDFRIVDGDSPVVTMEHFSAMKGGVEIDTKRTVSFRSISDCDLTSTRKSEGGELFFEDFVTHNLKLKNQRVWARQLNVENEGAHIVNDHSDLWVLGYKTERGGTLLETRGGGRSEILGGFSYTTTAGKLAPMFSTVNSSVFAFFAEVCYNGEPFETLISETRRNNTKVVKRGQGSLMPYVAIPNPD